MIRRGSRFRDTSASRSYVTYPLPPHLYQFLRWVLVIVSQVWLVAPPYVHLPPPLLLVNPPPLRPSAAAAAALAMPICQSSAAPAAPAAPAAAQSTGIVCFLVVFMVFNLEMR